MQGYAAKDLARSFRTVRKNTVTIAKEIPEDKYGFKPSPDSRSVAETLAHIAISPEWQQRFHATRITMVDFSKMGEEWQRAMDAEAALKTKAQIVEALERGGDEHARWLETLNDEILSEVVTFPPPVQPSTKSRFEMILSTKEHEMHHRAQLMVIERMLGIVPHLTREMQANWEAMQKQMQPQTRTSGA